MRPVRDAILLLLLLTIFIPPARAAEPMLVIEDNDFLGPGGSDIQSTIPLIANPNVKVLGFTVATGDGWLDEETAYLLRFLELAHATEIPVYKGALMPLVNTPARMAGWEKLYGKVPWKGAWNESKHPSEPHLIPAWDEGMPKLKPADEGAVQFLIRQVHAHPHQVTIVETGPMTNLALAISIDPEFAGLAKELVFMGAIMDPDLASVIGNADFASDFNFLFDPEAAHIALNAPWPKIVALGNVTNEIVLTPALIARLTAKKTPVTEYLAKYAAKGLPLWDELASAVAVDRSLITQSADAMMDVDIDHGWGYGRAHLWPAKLAPHQGERIVQVVLNVDTERFLDQFFKEAQSLPK